MLDVKQAVNAAYTYFQSIRELMGSELEGIMLEEVEFSENENRWFVTLGYDIQVKLNKSSLSEMLAPLTPPQTFQREYKRFAVNALTGEVESMKIRQV